jgi:hypothetical protein
MNATEQQEREIAERIANCLKDMMRPEWIPVTERLPADGESVLVFDPLICEEDWIAQVVFSNGKWLSPSEDCRTIYDYAPTHWMPLPGPPSEAK